MNRTSIVIVLFFGRICGKLIGIFARTQTRLLSRAQFMGWIPDARESFKLQQRQFQLFNYNMTKAAMKKEKVAK